MPDLNSPQPSPVRFLPDGTTPPGSDSFVMDNVPAADQMAVREMDAALTAAAQVGIVGGDHQGEAVLLPSHG